MIKQVPANKNNYGVGRNGEKIDKIIVHWIVGTLESCDATFQNPTRLASAHYGIGDDEIHQYVKEEDTAWHAGNLTVNRQSIGIEHEGGPDLPISETTYQTSARLINEICQRYSIPIDREHIKGHREIKATQCPGTLDIDRLVNMAKSIINVMEITEEQKRILDFLAGKSEGDVREAFGYLNDKPKIDEQILRLTNKVSDLEKQMADNSSLIAELKLNFVEKEKQIVVQQKAIMTANSKIDELNLTISELDRKAKDNWNLYDNKCKELNAVKDELLRVNEELEKLIEENVQMTPIEHIIFGLKKLFIKK